MAMDKETRKKKLQAVRDYAEANRQIAEEKKAQYDADFAYGWLRGSTGEVMIDLDNIIGMI